MRYSAVIGLGLGAFALSACGSSSSPIAKRGDASTPPFGSGGSSFGGGNTGGGSTGQGGLGLSDGGLSVCKTDSNCAGGQICASGTCVSARAGSGGVPGVGGAVGAGGQAQTDGGKGSGGASGTGGAPAVGVTCGSATCTAGETCCYTAANPRMPGSTASYACMASRSDGGTGCGAGTVSISCASTAECSGAQKCCQVAGRLGVSSYSCLNQCAAGSAEIACTAKSCGGTQVCCETTGTAGATVTGLACAASCAMGEYLLCTADADCPAPALPRGVQTTCLPSLLSPLFKICR
jgi:hypothetical protein